MRKKDLVTISRAIRLCCLVSLPNPIPLQEFFKFKLPSVRVRSEQPEISKRCTFDCTFDRYDLSVSYSSVCPLSPSPSLFLSLPLLSSHPQQPQLIPYLVNPVITVPWRVIGAIVQAESPFRDRLL